MVIRKNAAKAAPSVATDTVAHAMQVLREGAAALSGIVGRAERDTKGVTATMVPVWKPLLTFNDAGKVIETTDAFKVMRGEFKKAARGAQALDAMYVVEYRKVDHGSGVKVWTERSAIDADADVIDKLDAFTWSPGMRNHDMRKVPADLKAQVYKVQTARLDRNERQAFNNFKLALNAASVDGANDKREWSAETWKRVLSHFNKRVKDGETGASLDDVRSAFDDLMDVLGY